ncbi:LysR family transcriptional regulator [Vibrio europaeus]|uniref:LysR family transcriptional regulator n=1 Tax=Vibrio europaeus TaxID=300876 RepID=UPI00233F0DF0|nr:LysR family transcriptional regulator [Vibrio europaeus]MDC5721778.1 LysR family transcriptional regulator [Vibrio europaeus]MDC5758168.1 LysR family transcriptional regulator [Vibrio europaeus]MDC5776445.1 LysR family transcriptional regulator [Vibrio europaeus]MDC5795696.1 LysR family transcriptional regulator [Vibrio europaeus]MDC5801639.1 LysR family transcriptional regulator [Vibrio europaeus]
MKSKLHNLDLNLLKFLVAIVETGSTSAAAERLGVSQASVSRGLATLRETFGDHLFIRRPHGVEPSDLAIKLAEASAEMLKPLNQIIESFHDFNAEMFEGKIRIAINIIILELHGDGLFSQLRNTFPKADFELIYWQEHSLSQVLSGNIDYLIHFSSHNLPQEIYRHSLKEVDLCLVARKNHPILSHDSEWEHIHDLPIAKVIVDGVKTKHSKIEEYYEYKGFQPRVSLSTHSIRVLINKLMSSDAIMFGSQFVSTLEDGLCSYALPPLPVELRTSEVCGGYLQSKRGVPFCIELQQAVQSYFSQVRTMDLESETKV